MAKLNTEPILVILQEKDKSVHKYSTLLGAVLYYNNINNNPNFTLATLQTFRWISVVAQTFCIVMMLLWVYDLFLMYHYLSLIVSWVASMMLLSAATTTSRKTNWGVFTFVTQRLFETAMSS